MNLPSSAKQEPPTSAKVVLTTSHGEIQIELWAREAPLACKNFIQHCLNDYYNGTIFHRMIPGFMIQGGDPLGTGSGGQSIYGHPFQDEFHQRLRFSRRGIVAMATAGKNTNASQFFMTFGDCEHLNKKNTIFGKVVGDTVYNLMALQSLDTDENDRPNDPPVIRRTKVLLNPFEDLAPAKQTQQKIEQKEKANEQLKIAQQLNKEEMKKLKKKNRLTFDCEELQDPGYKVKSSHDMLQDERLSSKIAVNSENLARKIQMKQEEERKKQDLKEKIQGGQADQLKLHLDQQLTKKRKLNEKIAGLVQDEVLNYTAVFNPQTKRKELSWERPEEQNQQKLRQVKQLQQREKDGILADELNFKKVKEGSRKQKRKMLINQEIELLSNAERIRYEFLKKKEQGKTEDNLFDKIRHFTSKLGIAEGGWMSHKLKFHIDSEAAYKLDQKKKLLHEDQADLEDGGLKIEVDHTEPLLAEFNVDDLYDMIHKEDEQQN